jgi:hypothetical protein
LAVGFHSTGRLLGARSGILSPVLRSTNSHACALVRPLRTIVPA